MPVTWTNKHNLPQSIVSAIDNDEHVTDGDISVTQLIDAPQIRMLKRTTDYEIDYMDIVGMLFGTGFHTVLERGDIQGSKDAQIIQRAANIMKKYEKENGYNSLMKFIENTLKEKINDDIIVEKTLSVTILGMKISGTFDRFLKLLKQLQDYKTTTVGAVMIEENLKKFKAQLNVYAYMLMENGFEVTSAVIIAFLKDWSKMKVKTDRRYPKTQVIQIPIKIESKETILKYIEGRVRLHQRAENGEPIPCTDKDRWAKKDTYAVKKPGGKRALSGSIQASKPLAEKWILDNEHKYGEGLWIEHRKAESFRCANGYCQMAAVCPQYQKELKDAADKAENM